MEEAVRNQERLLPNLVHFVAEQFRDPASFLAYNTMPFKLHDACHCREEGKEFEVLMDLLRLHKDGLNTAAQIFIQSQFAVMSAANASNARRVINETKPSPSTPSNN